MRDPYSPSSAHFESATVLGKTKASDLIKLLLKHEENYRKTQAFLNNPPDDATIYEIHPNKDLSSKLIGSTIDSLDHDYHLGYQSGRYFMATLGREFSAPSPTAQSQPNLNPTFSNQDASNSADMCNEKIYA